MESAAFRRAYRLLGFSETLLASFAQANIPYAIEILLLLQFAELLVVRTLAHFATAGPRLAACCTALDARHRRDLLNSTWLRPAGRRGHP